MPLPAHEDQDIRTLNDFLPFPYVLQIKQLVHQ